MYTIGTMIKAIVKFQYHTLIQIYVSLTNFFDDGTAIPRIDDGMLMVSISGTAVIVE